MGIHLTASTDGRWILYSNGSTVGAEKGGASHGSDFGMQ